MRKVDIVRLMFLLIFCVSSVRCIYAESFDGTADTDYTEIVYGGETEDPSVVQGCLDVNADNYNAEATTQGLDDYGNIACDYSSCDEIPDAEGCFYPNNYSAFNADFTAALCDEYGGTACVSDINTTGVQPTAQDVYNSALQSNTNNAVLSAGGDDSGSDISISYSIGQIFNDTYSSIHHGVQQTELGCTHIDACNYNINATDHDGSCQFAQVYYNCNGTCLNDTDNDGVCNDDEILGCMDQSALNFDLNATDADGSCMIPSLITCGSSVTGSTTGTLNNYGGPSAEAIYRFEADVTGDYEFSSCGSDYDTYLRIYDVNMNELYSADDDGDCNHQAIINRELSQGSYYVLIEGYQELAGFYTLTVTCPTTSTEGNRGLTLSDSSPNYASNSPMLYNVQVFMKDSYGDGWNGNTYEISQSGSSYARGGEGFTTGYEAEESWMLAEGCYKIRVGGGGWPQEVSWHIVVSNPSLGTSTTQGTTGEVDLAVGSFDCGSQSWHNWARLDSPPQIEEVIESTVELELSTSLEISTNLLTLNSRGLSEGERLYCQLYDVLGNLLASKEVVDARTDIAMDYLPAAVYMLKVSAYNNETLKTFKMVKH